jgi:hypothetical protein
MYVALTIACALTLAAGVWPSWADVDLAAAADLYEINCASCHGDTGEKDFPNRNRFTSAEDLIEKYDDVSVHSVVRDCDTDCLRDTNVYIWEVLWGNVSCTDADEDTYFAEEDCGTPVDCDDIAADVHPGATEKCGDTVDNDCDGLTDCTDSDCIGQLDDCSTCTDADGDGFYAEAGCDTAVDCDDTNAAVNPDADEEDDDGIDNNCDGEIDLPDKSVSDNDDEAKNTGCFIKALLPRQEVSPPQIWN